MYVCIYARMYVCMHVCMYVLLLQYDLAASIPDTPENAAARKFLQEAPQHMNLPMPLGKEVKVMKCECKAFRHK